MTAPCVECGRPVSPAWQVFGQHPGPHHFVCFNRVHPNEWARDKPFTAEELKMINVIHVRGVKEPVDDIGISGTFLHALDQSRFQPVLAAADMDYGFPIPFDDAYAYARDRAIELIRMAPGPVVLSGYSGGALVIGDLARDIAFGRVDGVMISDILAVALLADPLRPEGAGAPGIPTPEGYGIAGQRLIPDVPVFWGTASRDAIASLGGDNPLRTVADLSRRFTVDPRKWDRWVDDMFTKLTRWQVQPWWMFWNRPGRWLDAIEALNGYRTTAHTADYLTEGVCVKLAQAVNEAVTNGG